MDYKLNLGLELLLAPPVGAQPCVVCKEPMTGPVYCLSVDHPYVNELLFDEPCFDQVLAIGFKYYGNRIIPQAQGIKN